MSSAGSSRLLETVHDSFGSIRWRGVVFDLAIVVVWIVVVSVAFRLVGWPTWLYYVVVFVGVIGYSLAGDPDRSSGWLGRHRR